MRLALFFAAFFALFFARFLAAFSVFSASVTVHLLFFLPAMVITLSRRSRHRRQIDTEPFHISLGPPWNRDALISKVNRITCAFAVRLLTRIHSS